MIPRVIESMVMPGGWHFTQDGDTITAQTYAELTSNVTNYRAERRIAIGDVRQDIAKFVCERWPQQCQAAPVANILSQNDGSAAPRTKFLDEISNWANSLAEKVLKYVYPNQATSRASRCVQCKYQKQWEASGCQECSKHVKRLLGILRGGRRTGLDDKLTGCGALGLCTKTAVWLDAEFLPSKEKAPSICWMHEE